MVVPSPDHPRGIMWGGEVGIPWQTGPVKEVGVNGIQADNVIRQVVAYLQAVNVPPYGDRLTSLAITDLQSAENWLKRRTDEREARNVEGTSQP